MNVFLDFSASLSFYLIPYLTGRLFTKNHFYAYILGIIFWFFGYFFLYELNNLFRITNFSNLVFYVAGIIVSFSISYNFWGLIKQRKTNSITQNKNIKPFLFLIIFSSIIYFLFWKKTTPYPLQLNWDIYEHITLANKISQGYLSFFPSRISDTFTFDAYSTLFQILLSLPKIIFKTNLLGVYWWLEYWHYLLTVFATFFLSLNIFKKQNIALLAGTLSAMFFESIMIYTPFFLIPQTFVALITIFAISNLITRQNLKTTVYKNTLPKKFQLKNFDPKGLNQKTDFHLKEKLKDIFFFFATASVILFSHYVIGILGVLILASFFLYKIHFFPNKYSKLIIIFSLINLIFVLALNYLGKWQLTDREEATFFIFLISQKIEFLLNWYGFVFFPFFLFGFFKIFKNGKPLEKLILILSLLIFVISFLPFSYVLKFYVFGRFFAILILAYGITFSLKRLNSYAKNFILFWLIFAFFVVFYNNQAFYKNPLYFSGNNSHISYNEIKAAEWLAKNASFDDLLISDPGTQYILEAVSGINTQGGTYMDYRTREILSQIYYFDDPKDIKKTLISIDDKLPFEKSRHKKTYFVVGGRYFSWQRLSYSFKNSYYYNIWQPNMIEEKDKEYLNFLINKAHFKLLYKNKELAILEI